MGNRKLRIGFEWASNGLRGKYVKTPKRPIFYAFRCINM